MGTAERRMARSKTGVVTSNKMAKTVVVMVKRKVQHPLYKKFIIKRTKFVAHDEKNSCAIGDTVKIIETRPLSRTKRWRVTSVLKSVQGSAS